MNKKLSALIICVLTGIGLQAQSFIVGGVVKDSKDVPVVGAVVMLQSQQYTAVLTDYNGAFSIQIPTASKDGYLVVNCMGFNEEVVPISGRSSINVVLHDNVEELEEVVVIGYGAMRRSDLTGSVASIKLDELSRAKSSTLDQMIEGRAAGVEVLAESEAPDAGINIRVRGMSSFGTSTEPLYVVDGVIVNGSSDGISMAISGDSGSKNTDVTNNGLSGINPRDIASVEILKDASATAIYGSQGANGVVLISTRSAYRDKPVISFSAGVSLAQREKTLDVLNLDQYVEFLEARVATGAPADILNKIYSGYVDANNRGTLAVKEINWQDFLTRTAVSQRYYFSVSGRNKEYNYFFSTGYNDTQGIIKKTDSKTITSRLNISKEITRAFSVGFKLNLSYTSSSMANGSSAGGVIGGAQSILRSMLNTKPYFPAVESDDDVDYDEDENLKYGPNRWLLNYENTMDKYRLLPSVYAQWKIAPFLSFKSTFGGDYYAMDRNQTRTYKISKIGNCASVARKVQIKYNWDNLLMVNKKFGKFSLSGTLGHSMSKDASNIKLNQGWFLEQAYGGQLSINSSDPQYSFFDYSETASTLMSFFGRAIMNYNERYILTATYRFDGSSKFQGASRWGRFPSFAFAWRLSNEKWFDVPAISNFKIRLGWGRVGNQNIQNYQTLATYTNLNYGDHFGAVSDYIIGLIPSNINNPDLKWETSEQVNGGFDLSLFRGRITLSADAYGKNSIDLLQMKNIAHSSGFKTMAVNSGSVQNTGLEFSLDFTPVSTRDIEWQIGGNIGINKNIITGTGAEGESGEIWLNPNKKITARYFFGDKLSSLATDPLNIFIEGQPIGLFYGYLADGIIQEGEPEAPFLEGTTRGAGCLRYRDINGDGVLDSSDKTIIGNPLPDFTYGFNTSLTFKNFCLNIQAVGSYGADIYNLNNTYDYYTKSSTGNIRAAAFFDAWSPTNTGAKLPGISMWHSLEQATMINSIFVEDASYLQIKNVSLSYNFPIKKKKQGRNIISGLSLSLSCGNLYTFTGYSGWTPKTRNNALKKLGVDLNSYPGQRSFAMDIKITF